MAEGADEDLPARPRGLSASLAAALLIEELYRQGCDTFVVCPGSRSTPLVAAIARHAQLRVHVLHDERSAAFFALGNARARQAPAAVLTTSGTAVANLLPAAVEAARDGVPLWLLSADRPPEAQDTDANQTVPQGTFLQGTVRAQLTLPPPEDIPDAPALLAAVDDAIARSRAPAAGPLHINAMFRKPLEPAPFADEAPYAALGAWRASHAPFLAQAALVPSLPAATLMGLASQLRAARRGMVVLGNTQDPDEIAGARDLAALLDWPLLACTLGNQGSLAPGERAPGTILHGAMVAKAGLLPAPPDLVLWCGGPLLSPELSEYVGRAPAMLRVDPRARPRAERPGRALCLALPPAALARALAPALAKAPPPTSALLAPWRARDAHAAACLRERARAQPAPDELLQEPDVAMEVANAAARADALFVGNSMPIRDLDLFAPPPGVRALVYANRGASGIDGLLSTAAGIAASGRRTLALLGDLSFLHDAGALSALASLPLPLLVVVVENGGGGIFDFLPIAAHHDLLERYFTTPHHSDLVALARAHGVVARRVTHRAALRDALAEEWADTEARGQSAAAPAPRLRLVVAHCPREGNVAAHRARYDGLRAAFAAGSGEGAS